MGAKKSAEQVVVEKIKQAILNREIAPGTQLVESTISQSLNISRTPIRHAFKRLEEEGYVTIIMNKGAFVVQPDTQEIIQAFELRIELESIAAKFGIEHITSEDIEQLESLLEEEISSYKTEDISRYSTVNKQFHLLIASRSHNKYVMEFLTKVIDRIDMFLRIYDVIDHRSLEKNKSLEEHRQIIDAIKKKDLPLLQKTLRDHLQNTLETLRNTAVGYKSLDKML
ncbi:GntR family transcriptional regulator [Bacillus sp. RO3]|nr:GntR family transcriptional regulator [Bacillus sp. RO3]